ncbi:ferritin-like domain-containing protein [Chitinophagaceae bacterium LB-8]|uniref:Ferritin-like domain-containing protein n=1 Tax=Paraflavisolibacter caeni TaxID=2982496 RepID=A0A9X3BI22_9BACT|nr:ferritin-like domain-containing protein [Paraflavisolibacter caeni]MCU7549548.1 ferritin-like domain-containing protein [Paraflavisolibacter caeni]
MARTSKSLSTKKSGTAMVKQYDEHTKLHELFVEELKDIFWAEKHLLKALPKMAKAATSTELANAFQDHSEQTENQIARLQEVFEMLDMAARAKKCEAMEGLVKEAMNAIEDTEKGTSTRDAALIISAQKAEHYEIASYGSLVQLAKTMNRMDIADVLHETLDEEKETDVHLTEIAESSININAQREEE